MKTALNLKENPFVLLLFTTIILLLALALRPIANVDFQDKVVFGIPLDNMVWIIPLFLMSFWLLYLATKKFLYSPTVTWIHVLTTVITTLLIVALLYIGITPSPYTSDRHELIGNAMQMLTLIFVLGQLFFIANIGLGILGRRKA
ncbi:MAG: hypothetical protein IPH04_01430 [Saprospirales bacterium]|jgi:hypothetical protein|nr:hypothetical protein [Saprospirales bacterium]